MAMVVTEAAAGNQEMRKYAGKVVVSSQHCIIFIIVEIHRQMHTQITTCIVQILLVVFGDRSGLGLIAR